MYSSHPSILIIKEHFTDLHSFSFKLSKAIPKESLPIKVLEENIFRDFIS